MVRRRGCSTRRGTMPTIALSPIGARMTGTISASSSRPSTRAGGGWAAMSWTRLDVEIGRAADELGVIDLRPERPGPDDPQLRRLMVGRLQHLETMGLAAEGEPGQWA